MRQGMAIWRDEGTDLAKTHLLFRLSEAYGKGQRPEEGLRGLDEALDVIRENDERYYETEIYRLKGELLLSQDSEYPKAGEAETYLQQALALARHRQAKSLELRAAMSLGRLWQRQGKDIAAYRLLVEIYDWFTEGFATPDLQEAKALLDVLL
jgi:predicted ATPase